MITDFLLKFFDDFFEKNSLIVDNWILALGGEFCLGLIILNILWSLSSIDPGVRCLDETINNVIS